MKRLLILIAAVFLFAVGVGAQVTPPKPIKSGPTLPSTCYYANTGRVDEFYRTGVTSPGFYTCASNGTSWNGPYASSASGGTVTSVSVVTANGFSGSVATSTTTPAITINNPTALVVSTSITDNGLTAARLTFAGTAGLLSDDADLTFVTDTLTFTKGIASTNLTIGGGSAITSSGAGGALGINAFTSTAFAPLASPTFTGNPAAPTQSQADNSTKLATTAYVDTGIAALPPVNNLTDTWNNSGTTFTALKMNVTNTASAAASNLLDLQIAGSSLFKVNKNGNVGVNAGSSTPLRPLSVGGIAVIGSATAASDISSTLALYIVGTNQTAYDAGSVYYGLVINAVNSTTPQLSLGSKSGTAAIIASHATQGIRFGYETSGAFSELLRLSFYTGLSTTPGARSGVDAVDPIVRFQTPADTTITASTEGLGMVFGGNSSSATVVRQHAAGALTTQREYLFIAPTYSFASASTITTAATLAVNAAPIAGTSATITNPLAFWVQGGAGQFDGSIINPGIAADTAHADTSVCQDTTTHQFYSGTGTLGICLGTSTLRAKQNVFTLSYGLAEIMKLKPIEFSYREGWGYPTNKPYYGFGAETMQPVLPDLVPLSATGQPNSVDMVGLIPVLVKAIQEQQAQILGLESKVRRRSRHRR